MSPSDRIAGAVLCGGKSSRMGSPKAWLPFAGEPLLSRVVARIAAAGLAPIVVVAAPGQDLPPLPPAVEIVRDPIEGRGPLVGILAALDAVGDRAAATFVSSTDAPFLAPELVRRMVALRASADPPWDAVVPRASGHHHPLATLYGAATRATMRELVEAGRMRPFFVFEQVRSLIADAELLLEDDTLRRADPELASLVNVNTPEEYQAARARVEGR